MLFIINAIQGLVPPKAADFPTRISSHHTHILQNPAETSSGNLRAEATPLQSNIYKTSSRQTNAPLPEGGFLFRRRNTGSLMVRDIVILNGRSFRLVLLARIGFHGLIQRFHIEPVLGLIELAGY